MQEEINKLKLELLACQEKLDQTNKKNEQLEKVVHQHKLIERRGSERVEEKLTKNRVVEKSIQTNVQPLTAIDVQVVQDLQLALAETNIRESAPQSASLKVTNALDLTTSEQNSTGKLELVAMQKSQELPAAHFDAVKPEEKFK